MAVEICVFCGETMPNRGVRKRHQQACSMNKGFSGRKEDSLRLIVEMSAEYGRVPAKNEYTAQIRSVDPYHKKYIHAVALETHYGGWRNLAASIGLSYEFPVPTMEWDLLGDPVIGRTMIPNIAKSAGMSFEIGRDHPAHNKKPSQEWLRQLRREERAL